MALGAFVSTDTSICPLSLEPSPSGSKLCSDWVASELLCKMAMIASPSAQIPQNHPKERQLLQAEAGSSDRASSRLSILPNPNSGSRVSKTLCRRGLFVERTSLVRNLTPTRRCIGFYFGSGTCKY